MKPKIIIPARLHSNRFHSKLIERLANGESVIGLTVKAACKTGYPVFVAVDDAQITDAITDDLQQSDCLGQVEVHMVSGVFRNGTERVAALARRLKLDDNDVVINWQGDEPTVNPDAVKRLASSFTPTVGYIRSLYHRHHEPDDFYDSNAVKVWLSSVVNDEGIWFTRKPAIAPIHIGVYAYTVETLRSIDGMVSRQSQEAGLEQLAWLERGCQIEMLDAPRTVSINSPIDMEKLEAWLLQNQ